MQNRRFLGALSITELLFEDGKNWRINEDFHYFFGPMNLEQMITVPAGFLTDGASVPRIFQNIIPSWGRHSRAAVIHDYLYDCLRRNEPHPFATTRADADKVFLEAMGVCKVNPIIKYAMYFSVRAFGWAAILN